LTSAVAEGNRIPFDIPEAESELVAGYNTEYSGMRFLFFFFAEWGNIYIVGALAAALFMGGWQIPPFLRDWAVTQGRFMPHILEFLTFQIKAWIWVFIIIQLRWTLPRLRVDQLMKVSWQYLIPISIFTVVGTSIWMVFIPHGWLFMNYLLFFSAVALVGWFFWRVFWHLRFTKSKMDINFIP
jgi:NADH-quinone oxidoreductase subunit H